ncbi:MAG: riboflavin synthase, alpha subunit [Solirubrobacterales bacterium]|nr:riboflavin synthase, alpha subunit [Solirubrobacterales bacterium]
MFTGLVEDLGRVDAVEQTADGVRLTVGTRLAADLGHGDSIAVNGVCLTAVVLDEAGATPSFTADVMHETLRRSSLGAVAAGRTVNLELAMRADARLGGHIVQGHVDGLGEIRSVVEDGFARIVTVAVDGGAEGLLRYVVEKGSIAIDGISLTVARVDEDSFAVSLIPETLERTTLGSAEPGTPVNLEVDIMAKYAEKMLAPHVAARRGGAA